MEGTLPAVQQELHLGAELIRRSRRIFRIDPVDMAHRISTELAQTPIAVDLSDGLDMVDAMSTDQLTQDGFDAVKILQMESGAVPTTRRVAVAALRVVDDRLSALEALIEEMRDVSGDASWPYDRSNHVKVG